MRGKKLVEQVDIYGDIILDYDTSLTPKQLFLKIEQSFPGIYRDADGMICGEYGEKKYAIRVKNVTYLGTPHPVYKKRIQIAKDLPEFYKKAVEKGRKPILLGVYTYEENTIFSEFSIKDFIDKKAHNSSAHVYISDIAGAVEDGVFQKTDSFGNRITVFKPEFVKTFLEDFFGEETVKEEARFGLQFAAGREAPRVVNTADDSGKLEQIVDCFRVFFKAEDKEWHGIKCYEKMIADDYRNKYQPEWAGFFLEYEFESYIKEQKLGELVRYEQDKTKGGIDLDLYFPGIGCYGDLKAHSENSRGIQGNDWDTVMSIIDAPGENNHVYYIVCEHSTIKDRERDYEVTQYWNTAQKKKNLMSYARRMKNSVTLKKFYILDIHAGNKMYLSIFKQGVNSNGELRPPKIMIEHSNLDKFVIAEEDLGEKD